MSPPPPDQPVRPKSTVLIKSPRDAATWAMVYRQRNRQRPRERLLKVIAVLGAVMVHILFLLGSMLGSPYEYQPPPEPKGNTMLVRLINNKPLPPQPPPVRGVPPKEHGPTHRGNTAQVVHATHEISTAAPVAAVQQPPVPAPKQQPVVSEKKVTVAEKPKPAAAPLPPITLPKPSAATVVQAKPVGLPPPALSLQAVQAVQPVPPQFQPEPPRKAQLEGTQPMPPLPSLALPTQPAQSALTATPPQIAVEKPSLAPVPMPQVAAVAPAPEAAAPPAPAVQPVPLPAQAAPTVNLQSSVAPLETPSLPRIAPQVVTPAVPVQQQEAQLAPVPVTPTVAPTPNLTASAPTLSVEAPKLAVPAISVQPQLSTAAAATPATSQAQPAEASSNEQAAQSASSSASNPATSSAAANEGNASASTAPNATPQGSETGNPGQPNGISQPSESNGTQGTQPTSTTGAGNTANAQGSGTYGTPNGSYIQLKPRGDTEIMSHNTNLPKYQPTRFDQYWTPKGESSVDTALRHAAEKTTVSHTFNLPKGIRIKCAVTPLVPVSLFGCGGADPPAAPLPQKMYDRLNLPTANASVPKVAPAAAATQAASQPVQLDNSAECAAARVSGGPMPPNCPPTTAPVQPLKLPTQGSGSWVPASDQFH
ncbi:hypothetical protein [Dyella acidiphila]|uniref:Meckel syndrome type 1 protein n=1 Tax=Dyella acidiphila TaxID=2775866 RepID=A0ABR9G8X3_9GAMM|nr:hypothetical protein [Dyella acidiphila]MBE1160503.1 hypothetical protein [Dyella acidiphila]